MPAVLKFSFSMRQTLGVVPIVRRSHSQRRLPEEHGRNRIADQHRTTPTSIVGCGTDAGLQIFLEPDPRLRKQILETEREVFEALQLFEALPGFSLLVARMHARLERLRKRTCDRPQASDLEQNAETAIACFDIRAGVFLGLISTMELQKAFEVMLLYFQRLAWLETTGYFPENVRPDSIQSIHIYESIEKRKQYWVTRGYRRVGRTKRAIQDKRVADPIAAERKAALQAYKDEGRARGIRITDLMVARAACATWHDRTMVKRWKANDPRCTPADDAKIRAVLKNKPHLK